MQIQWLLTFIEKIQGLTNKQKGVSIGMVVVLLVGAFVWYVYLPKRAQISALEEQVAGLNAEINVRQTKVRRLEALKKEYAVLKAQLTELEKHLPDTAEVEMLLKQVSDLGERNGLLIKLWRPGGRKQNPNGIYMEIPMEVTVNGGYHSIGSFFEKVGALHRIVNISGIKMGEAKRDGSRFSIDTSFLATTYSISDRPPAPPVSSEGGG